MMRTFGGTKPTGGDAKDQPLPPACGYITVASTKPRCLDMAVDLALSLREHDSRPVALVLGDELRPAATAGQLAAFDHIIALPEGYPLMYGKLATPWVTPFARTLFVDADCLAIGGLAGLWDSVDGVEFALQGRYLAPGENLSHQEFMTGTLSGQFGIERYFKCNSGVVYYRRDRGRLISDACMALYRRSFANRMPTDEILFALLADEYGIAPLPPPLPMAWWASDVQPHDRRFKLVHFVNPPARNTMEWLMDGVRRRRQAAGLPPNASVAAWYWKASAVHRVFAYRSRMGIGAPPAAAGAVASGTGR